MVLGFGEGDWGGVWCDGVVEWSDEVVVEDLLCVGIVYVLRRFVLWWWGVLCYGRIYYVIECFFFYDM